MVLYKLVCCLAILALNVSAISSQQLQLENPIRFLALGDSYTIGQGVPANERWPEQLMDSLEFRGFVIDTLRIIATTGWRTDNLINAIKNQNLEEQDYNLVALLIGVNNQYQNRPFSQYINEFPALLDSAIRYAGGDASNVFVVSIPDYAFTPFGQNLNPAEISMEIDQYNSYNEQVADSMGVTYFNITPISRQGLIYPDYVASDGLHPSGEQYTEWVKLMLETIDAQLTSTISTGSDDLFEMRLSPNPAISTLHIEWKNHPEITNFIIFNLDGRRVFEEQITGNDFDIDITDFPKGLYMVKLKAAGKGSIRRFVKL